ncbi:O-antigen ligase family protein [Arcobacter arenosus]|uniref:O-antigen ligase family protein n=1 Tax=Arcobacter arenosus TaxID=2576037 RepID=UPI003BAADB4B
MTYIEFIQWKYHSRQNLFAVCIPLLINYFKNNNNKMTLILLFIIYIATILSGGRTAIIVITVGTLSFMYYQSFSNKNINFKTIFISILIFSIALFFVLLYSGSTIDNFKINTSQRFDGWILYLNMIMTDNTLIGYGLQGTEKIFETNSLSFKHPHNVYVESLFSLGIIGFLLLLGLTLLYFLRILKMNKKVYNKNISVGLFCSIIIMEQSIGTIWGGNSVIIILLLIFISLNYKQNNYLEKK